MPTFPTRHKTGLLLSAVFLVAWILALLVTSDDRPAAEDPDRWVQGPPVIVDAAPDPSASDPDAD